MELKKDKPQSKIEQALSEYNLEISDAEVQEAVKKLIMEMEFNSPTQATKMRQVTTLKD